MLCVLQRPVINCVHFVQVEDIDKKFSELEEIKENNWEEKKVEVKKKNVKVRAAGRLFQRSDPFQDRFVCLGGGGGVRFGIWPKTLGIFSCLSPSAFVQAT